MGSWIFAGGVEVSGDGWLDSMSHDPSVSMPDFMPVIASFEIMRWN